MLSPSQPSSHWHKSKHFFVILNNNEDSSLSDFVLLLDECFLALMITKKRSDLVNQLHSLFSTTQQSLEETSHFLYKNMHSHGFSTPEATLLVAGNFCHTLNKRLDDTSNGIGLNSFLPPGGNESGDIRVSVVTARNTYKIENSMFFFLLSIASSPPQLFVSAQTWWAIMILLQLDWPSMSFRAPIHSSPPSWRKQNESDFHNIHEKLYKMYGFDLFCIEYVAFV